MRMRTSGVYVAPCNNDTAVPLFYHPSYLTFGK
jgi:hypothetical protein